MRLSPRLIVSGIVLVLVVASLAVWNGSPRRTVGPSVGSGGMEGGTFAYSKSMVMDDIAYDADVPAMGIAASSPRPPVFGYGSAGETAAQAEARIIKTGSLHLVVRDVSDAAKRITDLSHSRKGYVQSSSFTERGDGTRAGNIVVRVPVAEFDAAMLGMKALATVVRDESVNADDVTEQYTDLEARLRNAKAQEEEYLRILKQASSVEDILKVQERLGGIRAEIESMQGRLQFLRNVTAYSTVSAYIEEEPAVRAPTKEFRPVAVAKAAVQTLVGLLQAAAAGLITFVIVWGGVLVPLALLAWIGWRLYKKGKR